MKRLFLTLAIVLIVPILLFVVGFMYAFWPEKIETTANTPRPEVTLRRIHYVAPPMGSDDNWLYAELNWNGRFDREVILYNSIMILGPIIWARPDKMVICVGPSTIKEAELHRKVTLSAGGRTVDLYTELKGDCPGEIREGSGPL